MTPPVAHELGSCSYELDSHLHLIAVDAAWTTFALGNGAPELVPPAPLGRSVLAAISDPTTALIYRELFERVASRGDPISFRIRCDAPALRRFLKLTLSPAPAGFRIVSTVLRTEPRAAQPLLQHPGELTEKLLRVCSWCKRVDANGAWVEVEAAVGLLRLFETPTVPTVTHAMCDDCFADFRAILDR